MKDKKFTSGIYEFRNCVTNKVYIGQSLNMKARWSNHTYHLSRGTHSNQYLQNSVDKHGLENFKFSVILYCIPDIDILNLLEKTFISNDFNEVYNLTLGGEGTDGYSFSLEEREKISKALVEYHKTNPNAMEGRTHKESSKYIMSKRRHEYANDHPDMVKPLSRWIDKNGSPFKGKHHNKESKKLISEGLKNFYKENPEKKNEVAKRLKSYVYQNGPTFLGKTHSEETKTKLSKIHKQRYLEDPAILDPLFEGRDKFLKNNPNPFSGKRHSNESKKKMSLSSSIYVDLLMVDPKTEKIKFEVKTISEGLKLIGHEDKMTSNVVKVLKGKQKTAYGYKWVLKNGI